MSNLELLSQFRRLADLLQQDGTKLYSGTGTKFEPRWFLVMNSLLQFGPTGVTELAAKAGVSHPLVNRVANELINAGLVGAYRDRRDKRKRVLALTSEGRHAVDQLLPLWDGLDQALGDLVSQELVARLSQLEQDLRQTGLHERIQKTYPVGVVGYRPELDSAFKRLNEEWITRLFRLEEADAKVLNNPSQAIIERGGQILFAIEIATGEVLGTCALLKHSDQQAELAKMAVSPAAQGRGIGRLLGQRIVKAATAAGYGELILETNSSLAPALAVYNALGFKQQPFPQASDYSRADVYMRLEL